MSEADRVKWETRYSVGRGYEAEPDPFIVEEGVRYLPEVGRAVDLAGGVGRHALWLASRGLTTTLADISPTALTIAASRASALGLPLDTVVVDLDDAFPAGPWDVILVSFFLVGDRMPSLVDSLAPGGVLILVHPTTSNLERFARPSARWLLRDGALDEGVPGLETQFHEEGWGPRGRHEVRFIGQKPKD